MDLDFLVRPLRGLLGYSRKLRRDIHISLCLKELESEQVIVGDDTSTIVWKVEVSCQRDPTDPYTKIVSLTNPYGPEDEELLRWHLEDFAPTWPFEQSDSLRASEKLKCYASKLVEDLGLDAAMGYIRRKLTDQGLSDEDLERLKSQGEDVSITVFLEIEAQTGSPIASLHSIHWEVLEDVDMWGDRVKFRTVVRRKLPEVDMQSSALPQKVSAGFNILLVVARELLADSSEISSRHMSMEVVDVIRELPSGTQVHLEMVRPGTWEAFEKHLESRDPGFFKLVHFDMHGRVRKEIASLGFLSNNYRKTKWVPAQKVAEILRKWDVDHVILNACKSGGAGDGSLPHHLAQQGVRVVVAMSYKVMAVGARMFMSGFYRSLLVDKTGFAVAARVGREKMLETKTRIGRYKCEVSLNDFIIPVLYERGSSGLVDWGKLSRPSPILDLSRKQPHCPVGRELDILLFETRILSTRTNFVWLTGQRGVGKTTLLKYLCWWWRMTSFIDDWFYRDLSQSVQSLPSLILQLHVTFIGLPGAQKAIEFREVMATGQGLADDAIYQDLVAHLQKNRYLVVIEGIEFWKPSAAATGTDSDEHWDSQRMALLKFCEALETSRTLVILTGRSNTPRLALSPWELESINLKDFEVLLPIDQELTHGRASSTPDHEFIAFYEKVVSLLGGIPGSVSQFPFALPFNAGVRHPQKIYKVMLKLGKPWMPYQLSDDCCLFLKKIFSPDTLQPGSDRIHLIASLALFWERIPVDIEDYLIWLSFYGAVQGNLRLQTGRGLGLGEPGGLYDMQTVCRLLADHSLSGESNPELEQFRAWADGFEAVQARPDLEDSALLAEYNEIITRLRELDFLIPDKRRPEAYNMVNPMLTLALRQVLLGSGPLISLTARTAIFSSFGAYYKGRSDCWDTGETTVNKHAEDSRIQLEKETLHSVMFSFLDCPLPLDIGAFPRAQFSLLITNSIFATGNADAFVHADISKMMVGYFDMLRRTYAKKPPGEIIVELLLAYSASVFLCEFYFGLGSLEKFSQQAAKNSEYSRLVKSLSPEKQRSFQLLDIQAALQTASAARQGVVGKFGLRERLNRLNSTFNDEFLANSQAGEIFLTDPRLQCDFEDTNVELDLASLIKRIIRLSGDFATKKCHAPPEELARIQETARAYCDKLSSAGEVSKVDPSSLDVFIRQVEARLEINPRRTGPLEVATASTATAEFLRPAQQKLKDGDALAAKELLLQALEAIKDHYLPQIELSCHAMLDLISFVSGDWMDSISHSTQILRLADVVIDLTQSEAELQLSKCAPLIKNVICYTHLRQWSPAIDCATAALRTCQKYCHSPPSPILHQFHYSILDLLALLRFRTGREDIPSEEENRRQRYQILLQTEGRVIDTEEEKLIESVRFFSTLMSEMSPKLQMQIQRRRYLSNMPTWNNIPLYTVTDENLWWEKVGHHDEAFPGWIEGLEDLKEMNILKHIALELVAPGTGGRQDASWEEVAKLVAAAPEPD